MMICRTRLTPVEYDRYNERDGGDFCRQVSIVVMKSPIAALLVRQVALASAAFSPASLVR